MRLTDDRRFDSGLAMLSRAHGAPMLHWGIPSFVRSIGSGIRDAAVGAGHAIGSVADNPWVQGATAAALAATGVGAPAAAAIMAAQKGGGALLKPGGNIGDAIKGAGVGAVEGYGASKLGGVARSLMSGAGALPSAGDAAPAGDGGMPWNQGGGIDDPGASDPMFGSGSNPNGVVLPDAANHAPPLTIPGGSSVLDGVKRVIGGKVGDAVSGTDGGSLLDHIGGFVKDHAGNVVNSLKDNAGNVALTALAAQQALAAGKASQRSSDMADKSVALADDNWKSGAGFRAAGTEGALHPVRTDLSSTFANPNNPFSAHPRPLALSPVDPAPVSSLAPSLRRLASIPRR